MVANNFELIEKGSFKMVGRRAVTSEPAGAWDVSRGDGSIKKIEALNPGKPLAGLCFGFDKEGNNDYMVGVEYDKDVEGLESYTYPAAKWLVYRDEGSLSDNVLGNAWDYVNGTLLPENGLKKAEMPTMEIYVEWDNENNSCKIEIHIPYEKK